jgi:hypothetical protein
MSSGGSVGKVAIRLIAVIALAQSFGCAHGGGGKEAPAQEEKAETPALPIPKGHVFGKIKEGMTDSEVEKILGKPSDRRDYVTGKAFMPYYYGSDTSRSDWIYKGKGHVVFTRNRYNGSLSVLEVIYDPKAS